MSATAVPFGDIRDAVERIQQAGLILTNSRVLIDTELVNGATAMNLVCSVASGRSQTVDNLDVDQLDAVARLLEAVTVLDAKETA